MKYQVNEVYRTIQGEGAKAGTPLIILRLQGCLVGCPWCDTKHSWDHNSASAIEVNELVAKVEKEAADNCTGILLDTVLVTGGEPAEQDLGPLTLGLWGNFNLHLETSGTADGHMADRNLWDWVTVSPKEGMPGGRAIIPEVIQAADELKFVIGKQEHIDAARVFMKKYLRHDEAPPVISLQPLSANEKATKLCVDAVMQHNFRLSLQQHKILGLP